MDEFTNEDVTVTDLEMVSVDEFLDGHNEDVLIEITDQDDLEALFETFGV